jgi:hypothetical protein
MPSTGMDATSSTFNPNSANPEVSSDSGVQRVRDINVASMRSPRPLSVNQFTGNPVDRDMDARFVTGFMPLGANTLSSGTYQAPQR